MHRQRLIVVATLLLVTAPTALAVQRSGRAAALPDLDITHLSLISVLSAPDTRPRTPAEWEKIAKDTGLRPRDSGGTWTISTDEGELRVLPSFAEGTSIWVMVFPSSTAPVPDSILAHFLKDARYTSLDGDQLEIGLAPVERLTGGGTKARNITVSVSGGRLLASRVVIEWK